MGKELPQVLVLISEQLRQPSVKAVRWLWSHSGSTTWCASIWGWHEIWSSGQEKSWCVFFLLTMEVSFSGIKCCSCQSRFYSIASLVDCRMVITEYRKSCAQGQWTVDSGSGLTDIMSEQNTSSHCTCSSVAKARPPRWFDSSACSITSLLCVAWVGLAGENYTSFLVNIGLMNCCFRSNLPRMAGDLAVPFWPLRIQATQRHGGGYVNVGSQKRDYWDWAWMNVVATKLVWGQGYV